MDPIRVPKPPTQAFNKLRRVSDLIRAQTNHLKHVEQRLPPPLRQQIPQHAVVTEADAATYIAAMTRLFQEQGAVAPGPVEVPSRRKPPTPIRSEQVLQLAASAEPEGASTSSNAKNSKSPKKSISGPSPKGKKR